MGKSHSVTEFSRETPKKIRLLGSVQQIFVKCDRED